MRLSNARGRGGSSALIRSISWSRSVRVERRAERQQLVERQPQGIDVGAGIALAAEPLGRHVADRAQDVAGLAVNPSSLALASPKSVIQTTPGGIQQQVRRLDVAVDDSPGMGVGQPLRHLSADVGHAAEERQPPAGCRPPRPATRQATRPRRGRARRDDGPDIRREASVASGSRRSVAAGRASRRSGGRRPRLLLARRACLARTGRSAATAPSGRPAGTGIGAAAVGPDAITGSGRSGSPWPDRRIAPDPGAAAARR